MGAKKRDELRVKYGRLWLAGQSRPVLAAMALVLLLALAERCDVQRLEEMARCIWPGRPMDPEAAPGQQRPPCSRDAAPYGHGCYVIANHLDGSPVLPKQGDCGDEFFGPWAWPAGTPERCWYRFFPAHRPRPTSESPSILPAISEEP